MAVPIQNLWIVPQALARLTSAYITKYNVRAMLTVYMQPAQDLENAIWEVLTMRFLRTAILYDPPTTNATLDAIGALVGIARQGLDDYDYQAILFLQVAVNRSDGRTTAWSGFASILEQFQSGLDGIVYLDGQAALYFGVWDMTISPVIVFSQLAKAVPNGVGLEFAYSTWPDGNDFMWSYTTSVGGQGTWGSVYDASVGGLLVAGNGV